MATNPIQWFPGHMAKTRRMMQECLPQVDLVLELLDARIPYSSRNPDIGRLLAGKPKVCVLTKSTLADPNMNQVWIKALAEEGTPAVLIDSATGAGLNELGDAVRLAMKDKLDRYKDKGMSGRKLKAMIVGVPNVGKSSLINKLAGGKRPRSKTAPELRSTSSGCPRRLVLTY